MVRTKQAAVILCGLGLCVASRAMASVDATLDALHESGVNLRSLAADVSLAEDSSDTGDRVTRLGRIVLQKLPDGDTRVRATFTQKQSGNRIEEEKRDVLLQGQNLIDRDYKNKKQTIRQVRRPGEKVDLFKLGEGPFPLPVGQPREEVLKQFDVSELPTKDPNVLGKVRLTPKSGTPLARKFKSITVTVDQKTKLPTQIVTIDPNETTTTTATLTHLRINDAVKDEEFELPPVDPKEWNIVDEAS